MLGNNQELRNKKPRSEREAQLQGMEVNRHETTSNYTANGDLEAICSRYENGLELYRQGKVFFTNGMYKVNGYMVDLRTPVKCEVPILRVVI